MQVCITPFPPVKSSNEVAGGQLKKFPDRLFAVPPMVSSGSVQGISKEIFEEDNILWNKHVHAYKKMNKLMNSGRFRNIMDMNAGFGGFAAALEPSSSWVMNVVPTISKIDTLGIIYERGLIGIYHDWYVLSFYFADNFNFSFPICVEVFALSLFQATWKSFTLVLNTFTCVLMHLA